MTQAIRFKCGVNWIFEHCASINRLNCGRNLDVDELLDVKLIFLGHDELSCGRERLNYAELWRDGNCVLA